MKKEITVKLHLRKTATSRNLFNVEQAIQRSVSNGQNPKRHYWGNLYRIRGWLKVSMARAVRAEVARNKGYQVTVAAAFK